MSPCYQGHTYCNEKEINVAKSEMQSNAKHKLNVLENKEWGEWQIKIDLIS
jgi:hypothetical protein